MIPNNKFIFKKFAEIGLGLVYKAFDILKYFEGPYREVGIREEMTQEERSRLIQECIKGTFLLTNITVD